MAGENLPFLYLSWWPWQTLKPQVVTRFVRLSQSASSFSLARDGGLSFLVLGF
jgi:hypothetical protein